MGFWLMKGRGCWGSWWRGGQDYAGFDVFERKAEDGVRRWLCVVRDG